MNASVEVKDPVVIHVPIEDVLPNDYNPNEMSPEVFNELASDLEEEGLDQPIIVVKRDGKYIIVDGEHRWLGCKTAGRSTVPVVVREYSDEDRMIHTMRRNMLRGNTDPTKFTELVHRIRDQGVPVSKIKERMALNDKQFKELYRQSEEGENSQAKALIDKQSKKTSVATFVANLSEMVRKLVLEYGEGIKHGYMAFMWKGKQCLMVSMDEPLRKEVEKLIAIQKDEKAGEDELQKRLVAALKQVNSSW